SSDLENPRRRRRQRQPGQTDPTLLAGRQRMAGNVLETAQSYRLQCLPDDITVRGLMQGTKPGQVFLRGQQPLDTRGMANPEKIARQLVTLAFEVPALQPHFTRRWLHKPRQ